MNNLQAVHVRPVCFDVCKLYFHSTNNKNNNKNVPSTWYELPKYSLKDSIY